MGRYDFLRLGGIVNWAGEGTGAVASLPLWDMALAVYNGCYSFAEGGITPYTPQC